MSDNYEIRTVSTEGWEGWELPAQPYNVLCSPYGESVSRDYATLAEALELVFYVVGLKGHYATSWGDQKVNNAYSLTHYVGPLATGQDVSPLAVSAA